MATAISPTIIPIVMPKWGLAMQEGMVAKWLVEEGAEIRAGDEILDIENRQADGNLRAFVDEPRVHRAFLHRQSPLRHDDRQNTGHVRSSFRALRRVVFVVPEAEAESGAPLFVDHSAAALRP